MELIMLAKIAYTNHDVQLRTWPCYAHKNTAHVIKSRQPVKLFADVIVSEEYH